VFTTKPNPSDVELTSYMQLAASSLTGTNFTDKYMSGLATKSISATYNISGIWCTPKAGGNDSVVQLLVHGIGFDSTYWNFGGKGM
jgi:hypothetical protein